MPLTLASFRKHWNIWKYRISGTMGNYLLYLSPSPCAPVYNIFPRKLKKSFETLFKIWFGEFMTSFGLQKRRGGRVSLLLRLKTKNLLGCPLKYFDVWLFLPSQLLLVILISNFLVVCRKRPGNYHRYATNNIFW